MRLRFTQETPMAIVAILVCGPVFAVLAYVIFASAPTGRELVQDLLKALAWFVFVFGAVFIVRRIAAKRERGQS